jgi:DNA repair protein RadC
VKENLQKGHRERMRAEFRRSGLPSEAYKQLEMLLFTVQPQVDTRKTAHRLLNRFSSLQGVLDAGEDELTEVEGVGESIAVYLNFIAAIAQAYNEPPPAKTGRLLDTPERMEDFVRERLGGQKHECVLAAFLDGKMRLAHERLTRDTAGSAARVENSLRVTGSLALRHNAASVLIGHNHPNGSPMPSQKDVAEARRLKDALRVIGTGLTDLIIIGEDGETYSMARGGLLF